MLRLAGAIGFVALNKLVRVYLIGLLLLAFGLRVWRLDAQSLWYDEAVSAQVAAQGLVELTRWTADDIQPPLYYYLLAGWTRVAGHSEWALRLPSAFFGTATVALLWATARRLFGRKDPARVAAIGATLLAALSPLYVYYGQEARMYAQLTFFGALAGYALLRAAPAWGSAVAWWATFVLAGLAALYTHYFALFLLVTFGACALLLFVSAARQSLRAGQRWAKLRGGVAAFASIGLGYLPWLPAMLTRYRVDASYWQGQLKLDEALRHVALNLTTGAPETMLEGDALRWLPWLAAATALALVGLVRLGRAASHGQAGAPPSWLLPAVVVVPVAMVLLLASRNPKFNPRYLMMVSPAYLLLLGGGLGGWLARGPAPRSRRLMAAIAGAAVLLPFLAVSVLGLTNWYGDPSFTKAQWRELAAYVRAQIEPDERVVLVSGHAAPAWAYYAPDVDAVRLPEIDILDVNAVLGFDSGAQLGDALAGRGGAWLVEWQEEVVDPVGFTAWFLDRAGREAPVDARFWQVGLRHWRLDSSAAFPSAPQPEHADGANFDHAIELLGWDGPRDGHLTVWWRALRPLTEDYQVSLVLEDGEGRELGRWDGRPAGYDFPTTRWRPGDAVFGRYPLPAAGQGRDDLHVTLAVYAADAPDGLDIRDVADNPAGKRIRLGPLRF